VFRFYLRFWKSKAAFIMSRLLPKTVAGLGAENFLRLWIGPTYTCVLFGMARGRRFCKAVRIRRAFDCGDGRGRVGKAVAPHARRWQPLSGLRGFGRGETSLFAKWTVARLQNAAVQANVPCGAGGVCAVANSTFRIKCVIPHQANRRIIDAVGKRLGAITRTIVHQFGSLRQYVGGVGGHCFG